MTAKLRLNITLMKAFPALAGASVLFLTLAAEQTLAQAPKPQLRLRVDQTSGAIAYPKDNAKPIPVTLQILDLDGHATDLQPSQTRDVSREGYAVLDFSSNTAQGTNGPMAVATNACLGFGEVKEFTATIWFKLDSRQPSNIGPRMFVLGPADTTSDTGTSNSFGMKFQTASALRFELNKVTAEANFVWGLPTQQWLFVAMVYDGSKIIIYQGSAFDPATIIDAKGASDQTVDFGQQGVLYLGNRRDRARSFDGWIGEFRFYTGAASPAFIETIRRESGRGFLAAAQGQTSSHGVPGDEGHAAPNLPAQWILATAPAFHEPLKPLIDRRRADGLKVMVVDTTNVLSAAQIRAGNGAALQAYLEPLVRNYDGPSYVLLAGAIAAKDSPNPEQVVLPALSGMTARMKGRPTDYGYGVVSESGLPRASVGRFPARKPGQMTALVRKTLAFERQSPSAETANRLLVVQGNPGGGMFAEIFVRQTTSPRLKLVDPSWTMRMISHLNGSAFYLPTDALHERASAFLEEGELFAFYLGHSMSAGLTSGPTNFLSAADWANVNMRRGQGIFFTCGCFACQWDQERNQGASSDLPKGEAYGIAAFLNPSGPVAVIGATGESYAAPGLWAIDGLLRCFSRSPFPSRLGDYWRAAQDGLAHDELDDLTFKLFDMSDGTSAKVPMAVQRQEHLEMWTLLGDPALRLPIAQGSIHVNPVGPIVPGQTVRIHGELPERLNNATVRVALERTFGSRPADLVDMRTIPQDDVPAREEAMITNQARANHTLLVEAETKAQGRGFECVLDVPPELPWPLLVVRAFATAGTEAARGAIYTPVDK